MLNCFSNLAFKRVDRYRTKEEPVQTRVQGRENLSNQVPLRRVGYTSGPHSDMASYMSVHCSTNSSLREIG